MALRQTLAEVVTAVRNEAKLSSSSSRGTDHLEHIKQLVKRHYETLCEEFEWEHLNITRNSAVGRKVLSAGSRYYDWPSTLNRQKVTGAWVKHSGVWRKLDYGIGFEQYSIHDPAEDERTDPVTHWQFYGGSQFEVWPLPATNGTADGDGEVAFEGQKIPEALTADTNRLDLDGTMVTLFVAAEILGANGQQTAAQIKAAAAQSRFDRMCGNMGSQKRIAIGIGVIGGTDSRMPRHPKYIGVDN
jgi:hypothetical protein